MLKPAPFIPTGPAPGAARRACQIIVVAAALSFLSACVTRSVTLTNAQGATQTCQVSSRMGPLATRWADRRLQNCIDKAKKDGYEEAAPPRAQGS